MRTHTVPSQNATSTSTQNQTRHAERSRWTAISRLLLQHRLLRWAGHVSRMPWHRTPRKLLTSWVRHKRPVGAPSMTFGRKLNKALKSVGISTLAATWMREAQARNAWRDRIHTKLELKIWRTNHSPQFTLVRGILEYLNWTHVLLIYVIQTPLCIWEIKTLTLTCPDITIICIDLYNHEHVYEYLIYIWNFIGSRKRFHFRLRSNLYFRLLYHSKSGAKINCILRTFCKWQYVVI